MARFKNLQLGAWKALLSVASIVSLIGTGLRVLAQFRIARLTFETLPDDIYISTYPKSGTTLMQMIVYQLTTDGRMDFLHINKVCPWLETEFQRKDSTYLQGLKPPRCFKTHLTADRFPVETGRYIFILRDVRDVVVSSYHHNRLLGVNMTLDQFTEDFLRSKDPRLPSWFKFVESWWPHRNRPNVLFLSYEKMVADLEGTVRQVASFLGIDLREEDMPRILERCSFEFMKKHQDKFDPRLQAALPDSQSFIRQGKTGSGNQLDPEHRERLEKKLSELARKLGCAHGEPYRELVGALEGGGSGQTTRPAAGSVSSPRDRDS